MTNEKTVYLLKNIKSCILKNDVELGNVYFDHLVHFIGLQKSQQLLIALKKSL